MLSCNIFDASLTCEEIVVKWGQVEFHVLDLTFLKKEEFRTASQSQRRFLSHDPNNNEMWVSPQVLNNPKSLDPFGQEDKWTDHRFTVTQYR